MNDMDKDRIYRLMQDMAELKRKITNLEIDMKMQKNEITRLKDANTANKG